MSERYRRKSAGGQPVRSLQSFEPLLRYERVRARRPKAG